MHIRTTALFALILIAGCTAWNRNAQPGKPGDRPGIAKLPGDERTPPKRTGQISEETNVRKRVKAKEEPVTLIADDNMRCVVNEKRFKDARVGGWTVCAWTY
jgi:hypothetical protein